MRLGTLVQPVTMRVARPAHLARWAGRDRPADRCLDPVADEGGRGKQAVSGHMVPPALQAAMDRQAAVVCRDWSAYLENQGC